MKSSSPAALTALALTAVCLCAPMDAHAESYGYDAAGRLTAVTLDDGTTITYRYDDGGNLLCVGTTGCPVPDAGPPATDAGSPAPDGGAPGEDAGPPPTDGGVAIDAGAPPVDAGAPPVDAGAPPVDAGAPPGGDDDDAGPGDPPDGPPPPDDPPDDCSCSQSPAGSGAPVGLVALALLGGLALRRRRALVALGALGALAGLGAGAAHAVPPTDPPVGDFGEWHSLLVEADGALYASGSGFEGQTGFGDFIGSNSFVRVGEDDDWKLVSAGAFHSLGLREDGSLWAWGRGRDGALGDGSLLSWPLPVPVASGVTFDNVSGGSAHTLALDSDGGLWAWGANESGQLGTETSSPCGDPCAASPLPVGAASGWIDVSAGRAHSVALRSPGTLWTWGGNAAAQLGDGSQDPPGAIDPVQVGGDSDWTQVAAGADHTLALKSDRSLWGWGDNTSGQLHPDLPAYVLAPTRIGTDNDWVQIDGGQYHTVAVKDDGTLWAWGDNGYGQLGVGGYGSVDGPTLVGDAADCAFVAAGPISTMCGAAGGPLSWGGNYSGELGLGTWDVEFTTPQTTVVGATLVDDEAPNLFSFSVNDFAHYAGGSEVVVTTRCGDNYGCATIELANDPSFAGSQLIPYENFVAWTLRAGTGGRTVYGRAYDEAGNVSEVREYRILVGDRPYPGRMRNFDVKVIAPVENLEPLFITEDGQVGGRVYDASSVTFLHYDGDVIVDRGTFATETFVDFVGTLDSNDLPATVFPLGPAARQSARTLDHRPVQRQDLSGYDPHVFVDEQDRGVGTPVTLNEGGSVLSLERYNSVHRSLLDGVPIAAGSVAAVAYDLNDDGVAVGSAIYDAGAGSWNWHAFLERPGVGTSFLGAVSGGFSPEQTRVQIWPDDTASQPQADGALGFSRAIGVNDLELVVGRSTTGPGALNFDLFLWTEEWGFVVLDDGPSDANCHGRRGVTYFGAFLADCTHSFSDDRLPARIPVVYEGERFLRLHQRVPETVVPVDVVDINDAGQIAAVVDVYDYDTGGNPTELVGRFTAILTPGLGQLEVALAELEQPGNGYAGDPVNTRTGALVLPATPDLELAGRPRLALTRSYASGRGQSGALGPRWRHSFQWDMTRTSSTIGTFLDVTLPSGQVLRYREDNRVYYPQNAAAQRYSLEEVPGEYALTDRRSGSVYWFSRNPRRLSSVYDDRGGFLYLTYNVDDRVAEVTRSDGASLAFTYDAGGLLTSVTDGARTVSYGYTAGLLSTFTDAAGGSHTFVYDESNTEPGLLASETLPTGETLLTQTWDVDGRVTAQTDALGGVTTFTYEADRTTVTYPDGLEETHVYDERGRLVAVQSAGGGVSVGYDADDRRALVVDRLGNEMWLDWDPVTQQIGAVLYPDDALATFDWELAAFGSAQLAELGAITWPDGSVEELAYDGLGRLASRTDAAGYMWTWERDARGYLTRETMPTGATRESTFDERGLLAEVTAGFGTRTFTRDDAGRITRIQHADGSEEAFAWDALDQLVSYTGRDGATLASTFDAAGNLATVTEAGARARTYELDAMHRLVGVQDTDGDEVVLTRDERGRVVGMTGYDGVTVAWERDALGRVTAFEDATGARAELTLDDEGRAVAMTDPLGLTTTLTRDGMGRVVGVTSPLGNTRTVTRDALGRPLTVADDLGSVETFAWDPRGRVAGRALGGGLVDGSFTYGPLGRVATVTDGNGATWAFAWDDYGRPASVTDPLGRATTFTLDAVGRVAGLANDALSVTLTRDAGGNVTGETYGDGTTIVHTYDAIGRRTGGTGVDITYDVEGHVVASNGVTYTRDAGGRLTGVTYDDGKTVSYTYDARGLVATVTDWVAGETTLTWDAARRLTQLLRPNGVTTTFTWDDDGRLSSVEHARGGDALASVSVTRDARGDVLSATRDVPVTVPAVAPFETLAAFDAASQNTAHTWDAAGRVLDDGARTYAWNDAGHLTSVSEAGVETTFTYDATGLRLSRTTASDTTAVVWGYGTPLPSPAILRAGGADDRYVVTMPGGSVLYTVDATTDERSFFGFDESFHTLIVTDDAGAVTEAYRYLPYGQILAATDGASSPFTWGGQLGVLREGGGGLYRMGVRVYDAGARRFLSPEPVVGSTHPADLNPYAYARNNPLRYADPLGESAVSSLLNKSWHMDNDGDSRLFREAKVPELKVEAPTVIESFVERTLKKKEARLDRELSLAAGASPRMQALRRTEIEALRDAKAGLGRAQTAWGTFQAGKEGFDKATKVLDFVNSALAYKRRVENITAETRDLQGSALRSYELVLQGIAQSVENKTMTPEEGAELAWRAAQGFELSLEGATTAGMYSIGIESLEYLNAELGSLAGVPVQRVAPE